MAVAPLIGPDRQGLRSCCEQLLEPANLVVLAPQVCRVLERITPEEEQADVRDAAGVVRAFKRHSCIPPVLYEELGALDPALCHDAVAVTFAACLFPQRVFRKSRAQVEKEFEAPADEEDDLEEASPVPNALEEEVFEDELGLRLRSFWAVAGALRSLQGSPLPLWQQVAYLLDGLKRLPDELQRADFSQLLQDLSAFEMVPSRQPAQAEARLDGAALYLATCSAKVIARLVSRWREEAALLVFLRKHWSPPSLAFARSTDGQPRLGWNEVRERLGHNFQSPGAAALIEALIHLEQSAWKQARSFYAQSHEPPVDPVPAQIVEEFWQSLHAKLCSGFPYFAFRSRLNHWWKQCAVRYEWPEVLPPEEDGEEALDGRAATVAGGGADVSGPSETIGINELVFVREGYRLVRLSFFARETKPPAVAPGEAALPSHERVRDIVDVLFYQVLLAKQGTPPPGFKSIAQQHDCTLTELFMWSRRLQQRLCAYTLARRDQRSNLQIHTALGPEAKGWVPIACLARIVPVEGTLFWVLAERLFLYPFLPERHQDPCPFKRFLRELWVWANDDNLSAALETSAHPVDRAILSALRRPPLVKLWQELKARMTPKAAQQYLDGSDFVSERQAACGALQEILSPGFQTSHRESFAKWCERVSRAHRHWVIPVWHLRYVEKVPAALVAKRLVVDPLDGPAAVQLAQAMR
jgi:hypothetical protein